MIRFENVYKEYAHNITALADISLVINKGEFAFLCGPSGAGKTTIMRLVFSAEKPTSGRIFISEEEITDISLRQVPYLRRHIGMVFQDFRLLTDRTIFDNLNLILLVLGIPSAERKRRCLSVLSQVGLAHRRNAYPLQLSGKLGLDVMEASDNDLFSACKRHKLEVEGGWEWEEYFNELVEGLLEPNIKQPTFLVGYPQRLSPLAKPRADDPRLVERFEPFIMGVELGNAFTELNDPVFQRANFTAQESLRAKGDEEAQAMDEDFIVALEYGMPPTGGMGIGVDRLVMVLTDNPQIRETILFPQLRPK